MLKTVLVCICQLIISSPIVLALLQTSMIFRGGNKYLFMPLFTDFIVNLILLGVIIVSIIFVISKNKDLTKKAIVIHLGVGLSCLVLQYLAAFFIMEIYKNTNLFQ